MGDQILNPWPEIFGPLGVGTPASEWVVRSQNRGSRYLATRMWDPSEWVGDQIPNPGTKSKKYNIILKHSLKPKDIAVFAEEAVRLFSDIVVACGGDGTIREVVKHTIKNKIKLGIIPLGSGNSLAANLMIPKEKEGALKLIKEGFYRKIDVGYVNQHLFLSNMSLGLGAQLIFHYSKTPMRQRKGYFFALLKTLFKPNIKT